MQFIITIITALGISHCRSVDMSASSLNGLNLTDREARSGMGISPDSGDSKWSQNVLKTHTKPAIAVRYSSSGQSFATAGEL